MASNGLETFRVTLTGTRPLLMSSSAGVAPRGAIGDRLREINGLRKRTEADEDERRQLKFGLALYHDPKLGPYLPGFNLWAAVRDAAKIHRQGTNWIRGGSVIEEKLPLIYEGPHEPDELFADDRFVDIRVGVVSGRSIEAVRPVFREWKLEATISVNDEIMNAKDAKRALEVCGSSIGVGTFRQRFGRFDVHFPSRA